MKHYSFDSKHLEPFNDRELVGFHPNMDVDELLDYLIMDKNNKIVCRADSEEMARLIVHSINLAYCISQIK